MRPSRTPAEMQDESRRTVPATLCRPPRNAVRPETAPASVRARKGLQKDKHDWHANCLLPEGEKPSEAQFSPPFHPIGDCFAEERFRLCGKRFVSLRKAISFSPHKNARRSGEMLHTNTSSARFLTVRFLFTPKRPATETWNREKKLSF